MTTTIEFITALFCQVDDQLAGLPKHPEANTVRYKFCMHVLRVFRMPKQRFQEGDSPVLWTFFGSPGANFLVSTWVERPHCTLPPSQKAWKFLPETVRSFHARFVPDTIGLRRWMSPAWEEARRCLTSSCI